MVSDDIAIITDDNTCVLILVVMEYGLRLMIKTDGSFKNVLILVVMEYGLRPKNSAKVESWFKVLILVVMEYGLRL